MSDSDTDQNKPDDNRPDENKLIAERRAKLAAIREQAKVAGVPAFPNDFRRDCLASLLAAEYGDKPAPNAKKCGRPSWCPAGFCDPYRSQPLAEYYRSKNAWWIMAGISAAVDSRVVPLWKEYLWGGSPPKNLTADFGKDFTASPTTRKTTTFLHRELQAKLRRVARLMAWHLIGAALLMASHRLASML